MHAQGLSFRTRMLQGDMARRRRRHRTGLSDSYLSGSCLTAHRRGEHRHASAQREATEDGARERKISFAEARSALPHNRPHGRWGRHRRPGQRPWCRPSDVGAGDWLPRQWRKCHSRPLGWTCLALDDGIRRCSLDVGSITRKRWKHNPGPI